MGNKLKKILLFLITIISITIFASEETKAPNELITDNPEKEVTTVESMKTRDHATMSLSVTKVVPEDIMGKLQDGKLSVFISKNKKEPRIKDKSIGSSSGIDISKLTLKAYSNPKTQKPMMLKMNLSAEDIKNMQRDMSEEKKINVVENTDDYVRLEVENVNENEKIYISVMNGDKVAKSYRIGEIEPYVPGMHCWVGLPGVFGEHPQEGIGNELIYPATNADIDIYLDTIQEQRPIKEIYINPQFHNSYSSGVRDIKLTQTLGNTLIFKDDFFERQYTLKPKLSDNSGFRFKFYSNNYWREYRANNRDMVVKIEKALLGTGNIKTNISQYQTGIDGKDFFKVDNMDTFRAIEGMKEYNEQDSSGTKYKCSNQDGVLQVKGRAVAPMYIAYNIGFNSISKGRPGIYKYIPPTLTIQAYGSSDTALFNQKSYSGTIGVKHINIDIGDNTTQANKKFSENIPVAIGIMKDITTHVNDDNMGLSFMVKKNTNENEGIFLKNNSSYTPLPISKNILVGNTKEYGTQKQTIMSTTTKSSMELILYQKQEEFITYRVKLTRNGEGIGKKPTFNFTLMQGRNITLNSGQKKFKKLREINYTFIFPEIVNAGSVTTEIDPRLESSTQNWFKLDGTVGWLASGGDGNPNKNYSGMLNVTNNIDSNYKNFNANSISQIGDWQHIKTGGDNFEIYGNNSTETVGVKLGTLEKFASNNFGYAISQIEDIINKKQFSTLFGVSGNEKLYLINQKLIKADGVLKEGYSGTGVVDMSNGAPNQALTFTKDNLSVSGITMQIENGGTFPNTNGIVTGQKDKSIANGANLTCGSSYQAIPMEGSNQNSLGKWKIQNKAGDKSYLWIELTKKNELILTKSGETFDFTDENNKLTLIYKNQDITLGIFNLKVKNTRTIKNIGEIKANIDSRFTQVHEKYSWIRLDGQVSNLNGIIAGMYNDFIEPEGNFNNYTGTDKITTIEQINDKTPLQLGYDIYKKANGENEGAMPYKKDSSSDHITMEDFTKTDNNTKLIVSKYNIKSTSHNGKNTFTISGTDTINNKIAYTGNIQEVYKNKNGNVTLPITNPQNTAYDGSGSLNLVAGEIGQEYSFQAGKSGNINSQPEAIVLKVDVDKESLDATGIVTSTSKNIANKMKVTISNNSDTVIANSKKLEKEILDNKVKVGINSNGQLIVTKLKNENIDNTPVVIEYYYDPITTGKTITQDKAIKLGTFTLTISNPVKSLGDITFQVDKRIAGITGGDWINSQGIISNKDGDIGKYPNLISANNGTNTIDASEKNKSVMDVIKIMQTSGKDLSSQAGKKAEYKYLKNDDKDIVAFPYKKDNKDVKLAQYDVKNSNSLVVISKADISSTYKTTQTAESTFEIRTDDTIYQGKLKEEYLGEGIYSGTGNIDLSKLVENTKYTFNTKATGNEVGILPNSKKRATEDIKIILNDSNSKPVNGKGIVGETANKNIADKIKVEYKGNTGNKTMESTNGSLEVSHSGLTVGIDTTGGLTLQKTQKNTGLTEIIVTYYTKNALTNDNGELELGNFTLSIKDNQFEIDGDNTLDFGKMFYRESDPFETRVKEFKVKNPENKNIQFSVDKESTMSLMQNQTINDNTDLIKLTNIAVQKKSNTSFELQATANLTKETKPGNYQGEIEVTVTITDKK